MAPCLPENQDLSDFMETKETYDSQSRINAADRQGKLDTPIADVLHMPPSSSTAGFFQRPPQVLNQYEDDAVLKRAMKLFLPQGVQEALRPDLAAFGARGKRRDELITSDGWKNLQRMGIEEGIVAIPHENSFQEFSRIYWCAKYVLWCGSSAGVNCPSPIVDGVASLFRELLIDESLGDERRVLQDAYNGLVSRDSEEAWTSGQWMTERQGGSDVRMTETIATCAPSTE